MTSTLQGVILAGGESRRFGSPKAFAEKDGTPFYYYSIAALQPFVSSILLVTNPKLQHLFKQRDASINMVTDAKEYLGQGPLAGIYTAMETVDADWYAVIPIDVPFMEQQVISELVSYIDTEVDAIIPTISGKIQPLIAIYHSRLKNAIQHLLDNGKRAVYQLLETSKVIYVPMDRDKPFININHQTDYQAWIAHKDH